MDKKLKLINLRNSVIDDIYKKRWEEVFFFPKFKVVPEVQGYLGADPVMFIAMNPTFGPYPTRIDSFYYESLKKFGFKNAHLTDIFKIKRRGGKETEELFKDQGLINEAEKILAEEFSIIKPRVVILVGKSLKIVNFFNKNFGHLLNDVSLQTLMHYSYAVVWNKKDQFLLELSDISKTYKNNLP